MATKLGLEGKLYRNTGTYAAPSWNEITNVRDLTLSMEASEADVTTRASNGWREVMAALLDATVEFQMVWDGSDFDFNVLQDAFLNKTTVDMMVLDGSSSDENSQGLRAAFSVMSFSRSENLEEAMMVDVSIRPGRSSNPPTWVGESSSD